MNNSPSLILYARITGRGVPSSFIPYVDYPVEIVAHGWNNCDLSLDRRMQISQTYSRKVNEMAVRKGVLSRRHDPRNILLVAILSKDLLNDPSQTSFALDHGIISERVPVQAIKGE